ncbi:hypothetical protein ACJMK2_019584 [Sinanodonta woodiana]|uniref:Uncharacterized protein n=1 Tax=Sinanodonta woodiana TaxID=1069815 RepID=A0ABD3TW75_SINWO
MAVAFQIGCIDVSFLLYTLRGYFNWQKLKTDINLLVDCLKFQIDNPDALKQALITLSSILSSYSEIKDYFRESQSLQYVFDLLTTTKYGDVREATLFCLASAVESNVFSQKLLTSASTFTFLHSLLSATNSSVRLKQTAAYLILCLVSNNGHGQNLARISSCLHDLLALIRTTLPKKLPPNSDTEKDEWFDELAGSHSLQLWSSVTSTISVCANNPQNEENQRICATVLPYVFRLLQQYTDFRVVRPILSLTGLTVANNANNQSRVRQCGGLEIMIKQLQNTVSQLSYSESIPMAICLINTLDSCITENEENARKVGELGGLKLMVDILKHRHLDSQAKLKILVTLGHSLDVCESNQKYIIEDGGLACLIQLLTDYEDEEMSKAVKYILHLCVSKDDKIVEEPESKNFNAAMENFERMKRQNDTMLLEKINYLDNKLEAIEKKASKKSQEAFEVLTDQASHRDQAHLEKYRDQMTPREESLLSAFFKEKLERQKLEVVHECMKQNIFKTQLHPGGDTLMKSEIQKLEVAHDSMMKNLFETQVEQGRDSPLKCSEHTHTKYMCEHAMPILTQNTSDQCSSCTLPRPDKELRTLNSRDRNTETTIHYHSKKPKFCNCAEYLNLPPSKSCDTRKDINDDTSADCRCAVDYKQAVLQETSCRKLNSKQNNMSGDFAAVSFGPGKKPHWPYQITENMHPATNQLEDQMFFKDNDSFNVKENNPALTKHLNLPTREIAMQTDESNTLPKIKEGSKLLSGKDDQLSNKCQSSPGKARYFPTLKSQQLIGSYQSHDDMSVVSLGTSVCQKEDELGSYAEADSNQDPSKAGMSFLPQVVHDVLGNVMDMISSIQKCKDVLKGISAHNSDTVPIQEQEMNKIDEIKNLLTTGDHLKDKNILSSFESENINLTLSDTDIKESRVIEDVNSGAAPASSMMKNIKGIWDNMETSSKLCQKRKFDDNHRLVDNDKCWSITSPAKSNTSQNHINKCTAKDAETKKHFSEPNMLVLCDEKGDSIISESKVSTEDSDNKHLNATTAAIKKFSHEEDGKYICQELKQTSSQFPVVFAKPTTVPPRSKTRRTPTLGHCSISNYIKRPYPSPVRSIGKWSMIATSKSDFSESESDLQSEFDLNLFKNVRKSSSTSANRKTFVESQAVYSKKQNVWNMTLSTPMQQSTQAIRTAFSDCIRSKPAYLMDQSPCSVKSVGRRDDRLNWSTYSSPVSDISHKFTVFSGSGSSCGSSKSDSSEELNLDGKSAGEKEQLFKEADRNGRCPGCKEPLLINGPILNSRTYSMFLETSHFTCLAHRKLRRLERRHIKEVLTCMRKRNLDMRSHEKDSLIRSLV